MGKRELVALISLSPWCLVIVVWLFLAVSWVCLQFVIVVLPDNTHLLFRTLSSTDDLCKCLLFLKEPETSTNVRNDRYIKYLKK